MILQDTSGCSHRHGYKLFKVRAPPHVMEMMHCAGVSFGPLTKENTATITPSRKASCMPPSFLKPWKEATNKDSSDTTAPYNNSESFSFLKGYLIVPIEMIYSLDLFRSTHREQDCITIQYRSTLAA